LLFLSLLPAFFFYASYSISSGVYVKAYCRKRTTEKEVALTFDDGPDSVQTPRILDVLEKWKVEAAFFCIGSKVEKNRQLIAEMQEKGHLVGNHSYSHVTSFPLFSTQKMIADISRSEEALKSATGKPVKFFRPPFGVTNPLLRKALKAFDYYIIGWDIRSLDTSIADVDKVVNRIVKKLRPGSIILLHDPLPHSEQILTKILIYLSDNGYTVKRVDKLFNII
jgi:peptidoglycan/xylan/chitin deacetylase (PgdA/CDA1 family)